MRFSTAAFGKMFLMCSCIIALSTGLLSKTASAQQMVVDDATVLIYKKAQLEAWYGTEESIVQPTISLSHLWDFAPGVVFDTGDDMSVRNLFGELRYVPTDLEFDGYSYGWVGAMFFDTKGRVTQVLTYLPFTKYVLDRTSQVHLNIGFDGQDNAAGDFKYSFLTGLRGDLGITNRFTLLAEVFTYDFDTPSFQAGMRVGIVPDIFSLEVTYGDSFKSEIDYPGFNVGMTFAPNKVW